MRRGWLLGMALGLVAAGCASSSTSQGTGRLASRRVEGMRNGQSQQDRSRCDATRPGRTASEYDTNGDGAPDVRKVYQTVGEGNAVRAVLVCREVDLNHDGQKDVFRFYNDEGRTLREEEDHNFDGRIDVITYFDNGQVVRREMDTNGDGMVDMRVYYRETASSENARTLGDTSGDRNARSRDVRPFRAERELQNDNNPEFRADYWEFYDAQGRVVRIGWDYDRDGRADRWDRVDRLAPVRQQPAGSAANTAPASADPTLTPTADPTLTPTPAAPGAPGATPATPASPGAATPAAPAAPGAATPAAPANPSP
jgi:hypothetical protein